MQKPKEEFKKDNKDEIQKALEELTKESDPIVSKLYQSAQKPESATGPEVEVKPDDIKNADQTE